VRNRVRDADDRPADSLYRIALALEADDPQALLLVLLQLVEEKPHSWWNRRTLLRHLPSELGARATDALRRMLEALDTRTSGAPSK
jgi:hypothetical protein